MGNFTPPKVPFLKSAVISCHVWMIAESLHWLYSTFGGCLRYHWLCYSHEKISWLAQITRKALDWSKSYLTRRCQKIMLGNCLSTKADLPLGVLQGSVLGPLPFTFYTTQLSSIISGHTIPHHLYADKSHMYVSFALGDSSATLYGSQLCLASIQSRMLMNKLKLNPHKTKILLIGNDWQRG